MKILITGGTGFIGSSLCFHLLKDKHHITVLSRKPEKVKSPLKGIKQLENDAVFDVVINLAGEPIANKRWSKQQKQRIINSRINTTKALISYFKNTADKPKLLINGSAIGYYGIGESNDAIDETALGDDSFSSQLCQQWEATALEAQALGIRVCLLRTGIVLGHGGGALNKMLPAFKIGLGGKIGSGKQWMPWIHLEDLIGIILYCIKHDHLNGAINGTAPNPVTNHIFTKTLGKVIKRPTIFSVPAFLIKILMGQMGEELLLAGKKVLPAKILKAGYTFEYKNLEDALFDIIEPAE